MVPQRTLTTAWVPFTHVGRNAAYAKTPNEEPTMNVEATTFSFDFVMPKPLTKTDNPETSEKVAQRTNAIETDNTITMTVNVQSLIFIRSGQIHVGMLELTQICLPEERPPAKGKAKETAESTVSATASLRETENALALKQLSKFVLG